MRKGWEGLSQLPAEGQELLTESQEVKLMPVHEAGQLCNSYSRVAIPIVVVNRSPRHGFVVEEGDFFRRLIALRARNEDIPPSLKNVFLEAHFRLPTGVCASLCKKNQTSR